MRRIFVLSSLLLSLQAYSQKSNDDFVHTFSIVARDSVTGQMGIAVQSHFFSVGSAVSWAEAGVGAVATQASTNRAYGVEALKLLKAGKSPEEIIKILTDADSGRDGRQLAIIDSKGRCASYTGSKCILSAGNIVGNNFSVQGNFLLNDTVLLAMSAAFTKTKGSLPERLLASLDAGQLAGGDVRGKQSAAILIVKAVSSGKLWEDREMDLRVEDHPEPIKELKRLLNIFYAYQHLGAAKRSESTDMEMANKEYALAENMYPENEEMKFWHAVALINNKNIKEALRLFEVVFAKEKKWAKLIPRLRESDKLKCSMATEQKILALIGD